MTFAIIGTGPWGNTVAKKLASLGYDCLQCSARNGDYAAAILQADIVWIAAHPEVNCAIAAFALQNRRPVVVEKPVAFSAKAVEELVKLSKQHFTPFLVNYIHLFNPDLLKLQQPGIHTLSVAVGGKGPVRDYSAAHDYGSHAFAVAFDLIRKPVTAIETLCAGEGYRLHFGKAVAEVMFSAKWPDKLVQCITIGDKGEKVWRDDRSQDPLAQLIQKVVGLQHSGEYYTNGDLAVLVTMMLERISK